MYYLFLEIGSFRQLSKLQPDVMSGLISRLEDRAYRHGAVPASADNGLFLYRFPVLAEERHGPVLDAAFEAQEILAESAEEIAGYSLVIDLAEAEHDADVASRLREMVLTAPTDGVIWLTEKAAGVLAPFVRTQKEGGLARIVDRRDEGSRSLGTAADFAVIPEVVEEIGDQLEPWINGEEEPGALLVYGGELSGVRHNAWAAVAPLGNPVRRLHWPAVVAYPADEDPYVALLRAAGEESLDIAGEYLLDTERALYSEKVELLRTLKRRPTAGSFHRRRASDVQAAYTLYLTGMLRRLSSDHAMPGLVVESGEHLAREAAQILNGALGVLASSLRPAVVITSHQSSPPEHFVSEPVLRCEVPALSAESFAERANSYLGEAARRRLRLAAGIARTRGRALSVYHHFSNLEEEREFDTAGEHQPALREYADPWEALERLERDELELLFVAGEARGRLDKTGLFSFLGFRGAERLRLSEIVGNLVARGFLRDEASCLPLQGRFVEFAGELLGERAEEVRSELAEWCSRELEQANLVPDRVLVEIIERAGMRSRALSEFRRLLTHELDCGNLERAAELERAPLLEPRDGEHVAHRRYAEVIRYASRMRRHLLQGEVDEAERYSNRSPDTGDHGEHVGDVSLQHGRLLLMRGRLADAQRPIKRAIMAYQDAKAEDAAARAQLAFGLVLLGRERLSDARDYFLLVQSGDSVGEHTAVRADVLSTVCLFLEGKYTRVLEAIEQHGPTFRSRGFGDELVFFSFLEARTLFELGRYADAAASFQGGMAKARTRDVPAAFRVNHLWAARCEVYLGDTRHAQRVFEAYEPDEEVLLFRAECYERQGRVEHALETLERSIESSARPAPTAGESFSWASGFASLEDLAIGRERGEPVLSNLVTAFRGYLMARVGRLEASMAEVHNLTRQQHLSPLDPYRRLYFYFYSLILADAGPDRLDEPVTVLGKSVKHLRERTGHIDEYAHKTDFLHKSYWNKQLLEAAKGHNLL